MTYAPTLHITFGKPRHCEAPLDPRTHKAIDQALAGRIDGPLLLNRWGDRMQRHNAAGIVTRLARRIGIERRVTPHALRRSYITIGLFQGLPLRGMQRAARHTRADTTVAYNQSDRSFHRSSTFVLMTATARCALSDPDPSSGCRGYLPSWVLYSQWMTMSDSARAWWWDGAHECAQDWQWRNVPLPEAHLGVGALAFVLSIVYPQRLPWRWSRLAGSPLLIGGLTLAALATCAAGRTDLAGPEQIVTHGPYALSRHPMYVAWTAIYVGTALVRRAAWPLLLTPLLARLVHREVYREEQRLIDAFGPTYLAYQQRVRRYV